MRQYMRQDKYNRMMQVMQCHKGAATISHVMREIEQDDDIMALPGRVIGKIANIRDAAYRDGKSTGMEIIDDCVYIGDVGLVPISTLRKIKITETVEQVIRHTTTPHWDYQYHRIYRDAECTDKVEHREQAYDMTEGWYIETLRGKKYELNDTEVI